MASNRVEYLFSSLTTGFARAGEQVAIEPGNALAVSEDVSAGVTEELSITQQNLLASYISDTSTDEVEYDTEIGDIDDLYAEYGDADPDKIMAEQAQDNEW